ncbi:MAG: RDD family protein [Gammaproteobacteria bacterium]
MSASHSSPSASDGATLTAPRLFRRLASGFYDALILLAIWILATFLIMPFTHGRALESFYADSAGVKFIYQLALLALGYAFFGGFWTHGGQTVGMRTWNLRAVCREGASLGWYRALIRYITLLIPWLLIVLGCEFLIKADGQLDAGVLRIAAAVIFLLALAGFVWPAFDPHRLGWHDHLSGTRLVSLPKTRKMKAADSAANGQRKNGE